MFVHHSLSEGVFYWRTFFAVQVWPLEVVAPIASLIRLVGFFSSFFFWLCATLMSFLTLCVAEAGCN
jgi:hypothetical protein